MLHRGDESRLHNRDGAQDGLIERGALLTRVLELARRVTGNVAVEASTPFMDAGLESLDAAHFVQLVGSQVQLELSPTLIFEYATPEAVVEHVRSLMRARTTWRTCGSS